MELIEATTAMTLYRSDSWTESSSFYLNSRIGRSALSGASWNKSHIMTLSLSLSLLVSALKLTERFNIVQDHFLVLAANLTSRPVCTNVLAIHFLSF